MKLKIAFRRAKTNRTSRRRSAPLICPRCHSPMPRDVTFDIDGHDVCRICYKKAVGALRYCSRCRKEKPCNDAYFYRKIRGSGFMVVCRKCKDRSLRTYGKRMCRVCWSGLDGGAFSPEEWSQPLGVLAICLACTETKRRRDIPPPIGEKRCPRCSIDKPARDYYCTGGRLSSYCKPCTRVYNADQHSKRRVGGRFSSRTLAVVYHLQQNYTEQELVDLWAEGEVPTAPEDVPVPRDNFKKDGKASFGKFLAGYERALSLDGCEREVTDDANPATKHVKAKKVSTKNKRGGFRIKIGGGRK